MNTDIFKNFDANTFFKKITSPKASGDLNAFLENLPKKTGQTLLIMTGVAWAGVGLVAVYATMQLQAFTELRAELQETEAVNPAVPSIENRSVSREEVDTFVKQAEKIYKNIAFDAKGNTITISGNSTQLFGRFREAVGHVQNGGKGWRVTIKELCVGRECKESKKKPLDITLNINRIEIKEPK